MSKIKKNKNIVNDAIVKDIAGVVETLDYGTIEIKVHDSKIVQVEVTEKKRFDDVWQTMGGGGI